MPKLDLTELNRLAELSEKATQGEWEACGTQRGGCKCGSVWSKGVDAPVANVVIGKWGDNYASLRFVDGTGGEGSLGPKIEAYMDQITYGEVPEELAKGNMLFIAAIVNFFRSSLPALREAAQDARRYRWFRQEGSGQEEIMFMTMKDLDAAIDAKLREES